MKFVAFGVADYEMKTFERLKKEYNLDLDIYSCEINDFDINVDASIYDAISVISLGKINNQVLDRFTNVKLISLRSIGYQYLDLEYCKKRNIIVTNASYDPYNVADFTIMQMLMLLRHAKVSVCRALVNDFSLDGMRGAEIRNQVVGILGTGKIGSTVIKQLQGFGCKIYCYDKYENPNIKGLAEYKDLDFILKNCTVISLHMPLNEDNYHIINKESLSKMRDGVILINTARGALIDTDALIEAVENLKIGACALDTVEGEDGLAHVDMGARVKGLSTKKDIMYLKQFPNVLVTQHYAFFTKEAVDSMIGCSFDSFNSLINNKEYKNVVSK